jgi:DNA-binding protein H-NS
METIDFGAEHYQDLKLEKESEENKRQRAEEENKRLKTQINDYKTHLERKLAEISVDEIIVTEAVTTARQIYKRELNKINKTFNP